MKKPKEMTVLFLVVIIGFLILSAFIYRDNVKHRERIQSRDKTIEYLRKQIEEQDKELERRSKELQICVDEASKKK